MLPNGVEKRREQYVTRRLRTRKPSDNDAFCALASPFFLGKLRRVNKSAIGHAAVEKTFFVEAVQRGHHRGVGERAIQPANDLANVAFALRP